MTTNPENKELEWLINYELRDGNVPSSDLPYAYDGMVDLYEVAGKQFLRQSTFGHGGTNASFCWEVRRATENIFHKPIEDLGFPVKHLAQALVLVNGHYAVVYDPNNDEERERKQIAKFLRGLSPLNQVIDCRFWAPSLDLVNFINKMNKEYQERRTLYEQLKVEFER